MPEMRRKIAFRYNVFSLRGQNLILREVYGKFVLKSNCIITKKNLLDLGWEDSLEKCRKIRKIIYKYIYNTVANELGFGTKY